MPVLDPASINSAGATMTTVLDTVKYLFTDAFNWLYGALMLFAFLNSSRHGFLDRVLRLAGSLGALLAGLGVSKAAAPALYEKYMVPAMLSRLELALSRQGATLATALQDLDFIPAGIRQDVVAQVGALNATGIAPMLAALRPILLPLVELLTFVVIYLLVRIAVFVVMRFARGIDTLKPMRWMNHTLGIALGVAEALLAGWWLTVFLWLFTVLWSRAFPGGAQLIQSSAFYTAFSHFNPFAR